MKAVRASTLAGEARWLARLAAALPLVMTFPSMVSSQPIRLHPQNPRYFEWHGRALALVSSAEHYGAVMNLDFDYRAYLTALARDGMNYARLFSGTYVEPPGAFSIQRNTLAPEGGRVVLPWARSDQPGHADGGAKLDLDRFSAAYLGRLKDFMAEAERHGVVIEFSFFTSTYNDPQWAQHSLNPANHIQNVPVPDWRRMHTTDNTPELMAVQEKLVRWLVRELNAFDNLIFEIQNEPWSDGPVIAEVLNPLLHDKNVYPNVVEIASAASLAWQRRIAGIIVDEESQLPKRHLLAQNVANFRLAVRNDDLTPHTSIVNFHYAHPEAVMWNRGLAKVISFDESGFCGRDDATYRRQAWRFMLAGGGAFNSLDYSFTVGHEDGTDVENGAPGGGSPELRRQLKVLSEFLHRFDLAQLQPDATVVRRAPGVVVQALSVPGKQYGFHLDGRGPTTIELHLPAGEYRAEWLDPVSGQITKKEAVRAGRGTAVALVSPSFESDIALRVERR